MWDGTSNAIPAEVLTGTALVFDATLRVGKRPCLAPAVTCRDIDALRISRQVPGKATGTMRVMALIRFGGHLSKGQYDVQTDGRHFQTASAPSVHR